MESCLEELRPLRTKSLQSDFARLAHHNRDQDKPSPAVLLWLKVEIATDLFSSAMQC